ncbi:putative ABC transporter permease [Clostridium pasteurianum]|uniref:Putative membrane protein n=1 Tax=Clostridium pasteurianum BC1 TaxID=86416 RepID=R4JYD3_CLOPA|nr:putative ABC transporter permease [Clostridium pasteurianum]AGK95303.1 putative membrane protein [Clostridium pasteurianum BC1]
MPYLFIFSIDFYHAFFYFVLYSFLGWCVEVLYSFKLKGEFVNRGFLNGPFCPVYGFGAISIITLAKPFENNIIFLILSCLFFPSFIEYITGFILEKLFNTTWWDYSGTKFNLKGRICLKFSTIWFLVSLLILIFIHPYLIEPIINAIPLNYGITIMYILMGYFIIDLYITIISLIKLKELFVELYHISLELRSKLNTIKQIGDSIKPIAVSAAPRNIKNKVTDVFENTTKNLSNKLDNINYKIDNTTNNLVFKISSKLPKEEKDIIYTLNKKIKELKNTYEGILDKIAYNHSRIFKAYPNLKSKYGSKTLIDIQRKITLINLKAKKKFKH